MDFLGQLSHRPAIARVVFAAEQNRQFQELDLRI